MEQTDGKWKDAKFGTKRSFDEVIFIVFTLSESCNLLCGGKNLETKNSFKYNKINLYIYLFIYIYFYI